MADCAGMFCGDLRLARAGRRRVKQIDPHGAIFEWVTCISYAMVAGLIFRMIIMPESELADVPLLIRCAALAIAFATYFIFRRMLLAGVLAGSVSLSLMVSLIG